jgi:4-diphosphocytidyl-2-C-methyl-D-erythritol kinase
MAMVITETARAKVNLTLSVLGRRPDGYHELDSLVVFADVGDHVALTVDGPATVATSGPFAGAIDGPNLLARALAALKDSDAALRLGSVHLEKNLPVAAGLGGGSADAAALLRAVRRANPERAAGVAWHEIAKGLGADVPVCLESRSARMQGIGDRVEPVPPHGLPSLPAVLVNPRLPLSTGDVFRALQAGPLPAAGRAPVHLPAFADAPAVADYVRERRNDLEAAAARLLPQVSEVKALLAAQPGCHVAAMSGSGPTCFGVFASEADAARAAAALAVGQPSWWVVATRLGG